MTRFDTRRELILAATLIAFGLLALPALVYLVGVIIIGPYEGESGLATLYGNLLVALASLEPAAWFLILSPYLIILLLRCIIRLRRPGKDDVNGVTKQPPTRAPARPK